MDAERITWATLGGMVALLGLTLLVTSLRRLGGIGPGGARRGGWLIAMAWVAGALVGIGLVLLGVLAAAFVLSYRGH